MDSVRVIAIVMQMGHDFILVDLAGKCQEAGGELIGFGFAARRPAVVLSGHQVMPVVFVEHDMTQLVGHYDTAGRVVQYVVESDEPFLFDDDIEAADADWQVQLINAYPHAGGQFIGIVHISSPECSETV